MKEYSIYWIEEEVAKHYFHKSDILLRFLEEYEDEPNRKDLKAQFVYITHHIHFHEISNHLNKYLTENMTIHTNGNRIYLNKDGHSILVQVDKGCLNFRCKHLEEAVMVLFPMLRDFYPYLFVQGKNVSNYGWISPILQKDNVQLRQVLYSCQ